jgi:hypothetical protein
MIMKRILFVLGVMMMGLNAQAQGVWGTSAADSVKCYENYNIFGSYYQSKEYLSAFEPLMAVYETCPAAKKATYIYGPKIVEEKIEATTDPVLRQKYVDVLIKMYDDRLKYFPEKEGYVLSEKASKYIKYNADSLATAAQYFEDAYNAAGNEMTASQLNAYFLTNIKLFNDTKDVDRLFMVYNRAIEALEHNAMKYSNEVSELEAKRDSVELTSKESSNLSRSKQSLENYDKVQSNIEKALSPLLTCEKLAIIYNQEKFDANKGDVEWLKRAATMLQKEREGEDGEMTSCTDNEVFLQIAETLYELEPSASAARSMAKLGVRQSNWEMAKKYYTESIAQEEDLRKKADDYMGLAYVNNKMGLSSAAKTNCLKAGQLRKDWGNPYLYLATIYAEAAGSCGSNAVEKNAVYWAAINKLNYAKSIDPEVADKAQKLINAYSKAVPDKGVAFQLGYKEGDTVNIGCWIGETVTVKFY